MTPLALLTLFHVAISLLGLASGFVVLWGMVQRRPLSSWTGFFLGTTIATSVTGYFFPVEKILPSHILGALSLIALAVAVYALRAKNLTGIWKPVFAIAATVSQYFNFFVLIVQSFLKIPFLHTLAPTQAEPAFVIAQSLALVCFVILGYLACRRFIGRSIPQPAM